MKFNITESSVTYRNNIKSSCMTAYQIEAESYEEAQAIVFAKAKPIETTIEIEHDEVTQKRRWRLAKEEAFERRRKIDEDDKEWRKNEEERLLRKQQKTQKRNEILVKENK
jgi:hypothetical protein